MKPRLIDVHTHVQFKAYDIDRDAVMQRALDAGIWMINVGTQKDTSAHSRELAHKYDGAWTTVGLHPIHTEKIFHDENELGIADKQLGGFISRGEDFDYEYYKKLAEDRQVVAIGECGLDYYRLTEDTKAKQAEVFIKQVELAHEIKKPLMIHCREAFADLIELLIINYALLATSSGIIHFFSGTTEDATKLMDLGFSFSFGGAITFARAYEKLIKFIPLDRILLETDAPYVTPQSYRGKRNEPIYVEEVAKKVSRILNKDFNEVARVTTENAIGIFGLNHDIY
jgi:TatD DNase family protein